MRYDRYIGQWHYWIRFYNGTHEVRCAEEVNYDEYVIETVYTGYYEVCVNFINEREIEYKESLF